jgi:hypothetical protein
MTMTEFKIGKDLANKSEGICGSNLFDFPVPDRQIEIIAFTPLEGNRFSKTFSKIDLREKSPNRKD